MVQLISLANRNDCRFPFDWTNPIGYLIAIFIEAILIWVPINDTAASWSFTIASFVFGLSSAKDLTRGLKRFNKNMKRKQAPCHIMKQLTELLDFYSCLKRYADHCITSLSRSHQ